MDTETMVVPKTLKVHPDLHLVGGLSHLESRKNVKVVTSQICRLYESAVSQIESIMSQTSNSMINDLL
jgi:hypothetical protein